VYKKIGKPVFFIVAIIIAAICYVTVAGIPGPTNGDIKTTLVDGITNLRLGIDIKGGVDVTFTPPTDQKNVTKAQMDAATAIINKRLDDKNISDRYVSTDYDKHRVIVRFPWQAGTTDFDPETAIKELGSTGKLTFNAPDGTEILGGSADIVSAKPAVASGTENGPYVVDLTLTTAGSKKFSVATGKYIGKNITINMDGKQVSNPQVQTQINDTTCIIDGQTSAEAKTLADTINAGILPFALNSQDFSTISPTLGANALGVMVMAATVAFILICLFMLLYYRLPGFIACIGLCGHLAGMMLAMSLFHYTLTLPGIAGLILSIGMGVDCNIITAARIKEELRAGRTLDAAIDQGFDRSFSAILDGNVTVLIVGFILMWLGSATITSFGFTLVSGVVLNFIMGIIASRFMLKSASRYSFLRKNVLYGEAAK
jgi:preprotein translocase subunit SecD